MVRGIVIPAVPFLPLEEREFSGSEQYTDVIGGPSESLSMSEAPLVLHVEEKSVFASLRTNPRATLLWWLLEPSACGGDFLDGDVVLTPQEPGSDAGFFDLLLQTTFRVEVELSAAPGIWVTGDQSFPSWFEAAEFAISLTQRFAFVTGIKVVAP